MERTRFDLIFQSSKNLQLGREPVHGKHEGHRNIRSKQNRSQARLFQRLQRDSKPASQTETADRLTQKRYLGNNWQPLLGEILPPDIKTRILEISSE